MIIAGKQSDLDVAAAFAETEEGVRTGDRTAESIDRDVGAAIGEGENPVDHRVVLARVDHGCGPDFLCEFQNLRIDVHRNDPGAQRNGDHDGRQSDTPAAVDSNPHSGCHVALGDNRSIRGREAAPQTGRGHEAHIVRKAYKVDVGVMDRNVFGKGPPMGKTGLGLMVADLVIAGAALRAGAAGTHKWNGHAIALFPLGDPGSDLLDGAGQLVTRHMRKVTDIGIVPQPTVPITAADPARLDLDDHALGIDSRVVQL